MGGETHTTCTRGMAQMVCNEACSMGMGSEGPAAFLPATSGNMFRFHSSSMNMA